METYENKMREPTKEKRESFYGLIKLNTSY